MKTRQRPFKFLLAQHLLVRRAARSAVVFLGLSLFLTPSLSRAQVAIGAEGGANIGNMSYMTVPAGQSISAHVGYLFGVVGEIGFGQIFSFMPEVRFNQRSFSALLSASNVTAVTTLNYLEIPLMVKAKLPLSSPIIPFVVVGPNIGFQLGNSVAETNSAGQSLNTSTLTLNYSSFDIGLDVGIGADIKVAPGITAFLEGRYLLGFVNLDSLADGNTQKTSGIQIIAGATFGF